MQQLKASKNEKGLWDIEGLQKWEDTYALMLHSIEEGHNFKFARYGDGEAICMLQVPGKEGNCDGHQYFPSLGASLRESFSEKVMCGIQPLLLTSKYAEDFMKIADKHLTGGYFNADVLHNASIDLKLSHFLESIHKSERPLIVVGPPILKALFMDPIQYIEIPYIDCWISHDKTKKALAKSITENCIVLLCASMESEVLIKEFEETECTMIDCGSVFMPFVGIKSRKYHFNLPSYDVSGH